MAAAAGHRIEPLLWRALAAASSLDALGPHRKALGRVADAFKMEAHLLLPRAVALAVRPLTDAGLEPVVFKGPAVAARYPAPGLRPIEDIDLLLPRAHHPRALDALRAAGWRILRAGGGDRYDIGYQLNYALTTARGQRHKILLVLLGSGHGFGRRARADSLPRRALTRAPGRG